MKMWMFSCAHVCYTLPMTGGRLGISDRRAHLLRAGESLVGGVIGVGMFGIPFAFMQAGFVVGLLYLLVLGVVFMTMLMMYSEVVLATPGRHQLSGYMARAFGKRWGAVGALITLCGNWGALVAYVLVGGQFAHVLLHGWIGGTVFLYQLVFMIMGFLVALRGIATVARVETLLVGMLILVILLLAVGGAPHVQWAFLSTLTPHKFFLPYGVVLFSFGGIGIVPELRDVLGRHHAHLRRVIPWSYVVILALYALFAFAVIGVSGPATTSEAIEGLASVLGTWALVAGALMGLLAVVTSFFLIAVSTQDLLELDYGFSRLLAWFLTLLVPASLVLWGARNFIEVIGFTGAVFGGSSALCIGALYLHLHRRRVRLHKEAFVVPVWVVFSMMGLFVTGVLLQVLHDTLGIL